jgi:hypothetical protein
MDTTLVGVTLVSMAMALALSIVVWRLLRDERRRSEARVAALTEMTARASDGPPSGRPLVVRTATPAVDVGKLQTARPLDLPLNDRPTQAGSLFTAPERTSPWGGRLAVMGMLALAGAALVLMALTVRTRTFVEQHAAGTQQAETAPTTPPPLELLSLHDAREGSTLTITGLVQNPRGGATLTRVTVTAFVFDKSGAFLASGRALLDVTLLGPGDQSPFLVTVPVTGAVARYRVGFRGEDGHVIAHIDKRLQAAVADATRNPVPDM